MPETIFWGGAAPGQAAQPAQPAAGSAGDFDVFSVGNSVYLNGVVNVHSVQRMIKLSQEVISSQQSGVKPDYFLYINSYGGYLSEMFRFADFLENSVMPKTSRQVSVIQGNAMSAASFIAACFPERWITKRSVIMMHELWSFSGGNFTSLESYVKSLEENMRMLVEVYVKATGKSEKEIRNSLLRESYFTAVQAKKFGLVHKIL